jgi:16S rRNA (guanine527-N7)-methyltransferase
MSEPRANGIIRGEEDFANAFCVSRETLIKLKTYAALLNEWQRTINLVAPNTLSEIWHRHFADSAQLLALTPEGSRRWLDLGSGAGFPGLVLAILLTEKGSGSVTLVESDSRKAAFLREVARSCGVSVDILCGRIESASTHFKVGKSDVVTARALAPLNRLLGLAMPFFSRNSIGVFLKGREVEREIEDARQEWRFDLDLIPSRTDPSGRIAVIRNLTVKAEG